MVNYQILNRLMPITGEEKELLEGRGQIDRKLYMLEDADQIRSRFLLEKGKLIDIRPHTRFVEFPEHDHDYIEVVYMCSGSTTHIIDGRVVRLEEGELLFLSRHARHSIRYAGEGDVAINLIVLPEFFRDMTTALGEEETPLKSFITDSLCNSGGPDFLLFQVADVLPVQNLMENLIWMLLYDTKNRRNMMRSTMELLFAQLLSYTDALEYTDPQDKAVLELLRYIDDNYRDGSLSGAAEKLHYDFVWLSKEVKKKTGMTYTQLLQKKRLSQAVFLLRNTNLAIEDIAEQVGYENVSYFYRLFQRVYYVTPKEYRDGKSGHILAK